MSQSPQRGPSGATTDFRTPGEHAPRAQDPAFGAPVHADAPTGTIPPLVTGSAVDRDVASGPGTSTADANTVATARPQATTTSHRPADAQAERPAAPAATAPRSSGRSRGPRRARLQLRNINPWTVLKFSCVLSIALFFVWLIVVGVLFGVLDAAGIIGKINDTVVQLNGQGSDAPITAGIVFGAAAIIGVVNIVLFIALSTIGSVVYNLCADLVGGVEVTLSER